ncbi:MAG: PIG-L family deacetylase [Chloroflexota bacterium]|nr:PIG-L family deacetylase [Chloroflexota bacterium]
MSPAAEIRLQEERPGRLLVVAAHPGDADSAVAGSVSRWIVAGSVVHLVCCTSGDASADDAAADPLEVAAAREAEQRAAAAIVGYEDVSFMHRPEGALANDLALREQLVRLIRMFRPDVVAAPDPRLIVDERGFVQHVDHRAAGAAAVDAVSPAAHTAMTFPHLVKSEGLRPHRVGRLLLYWPERVNAIVDISDTVETKLSALRAHASRHSQADDLDGRVRGRARDEGAPVGIEAGESYAVIDLR